jgi:hypothetical protein
VVEWMANNLMTTYKVKDCFDVMEQKVTNNIRECMHMGGIAPGPDSGKRIPTKWKRCKKKGTREKKAGKRDKKSAKSEKKKKEPRKKKTKALPGKEKEPPTMGKEKEPPKKVKQAPTKGKVKDTPLSNAQKYYNMLREATKDDPALFSFVAKYNNLCGDDKTDLPRCYHAIKELSRSSLAEIWKAHHLEDPESALSNFPPIRGPPRCVW